MPYSFRNTSKKFWKLLALQFLILIIMLIINFVANSIIGYGGSEVLTTTAFISIIFESIIDSYLGIVLLAGITDYLIQFFS